MFTSYQPQGITNMRLDMNTAPVTVSGGGAASTFGIEMNAKAFRVLSDTLYQNKIGSIVREVSCNALDSHIMANKKDVPIVIHLPNAFEPWFSVQDFGVGLSAESIKQVFTQYFKSTKDNSNDTIGAFGLGSKTPFSYTDQFTITSTFQGVTTIYSAYIDENGLPNIVEMHAEKCSDDASNGVEIKVSVKREDYTRFATEVLTQLRYFKVKPTLVNAGHYAFDVSTDTPLFDVGGFVLYSRAPGYGKSHVTAIQGSVGYPLDMNQLRGKISDAAYTFLFALSGNTVELTFPIGSIGVTASREAIEYTASTIASIEKLVDEARVATAKELNRMLKNANTEWERVELLNTPGIHTIARASGGKFDIGSASSHGTGMYKFDLDPFLYGVPSGTSVNRYNHSPVVQAYHWPTSKAVRSKITSTTGCYVVPHKDSHFVFLLRDTKMLTNIRALQYRAELTARFKGKTIVMHELARLDGTEWQDSHINELKKALGGYANIVRMSSIQVERAVADSGEAAERKKYNRPTFYKYNNGTGYNVRNFSKEFTAIADIEEETLYVLIDDMAPCEAGNGVHEIARYQDLLRFRKNVPDLIAIRKSDEKKIQKNAELVRLCDYLAAVDEELLKDKKTLRTYVRSQIATRALAHINASLRDATTRATLNQIAGDKKVVRFLNLVCDTYDGTRGVINPAFTSYLGVKLEAYNNRINAYDKPVEKVWASFVAQYPLLEVYGNWYVQTRFPAEHLAKYLQYM